MPRGFHRSRSKRGPKNNVWTVALEDEVVLAAGATLTFDIVNRADWQRSGGANERATLMRVRGWLSVIHKISSGSIVLAPWFAYISIQDENAASSSASDVTTYADEDILWTGGGMFSFTDTGDAVSHMQEIDVKAMRRFNAGGEVRLVLTNSSIVAMSVTGVQRGLLRIGGN